MDADVGMVTSVGEFPGRGSGVVVASGIRPGGGISTTGEMGGGSVVGRGFGKLGVNSGIAVAGFVIAKGSTGSARAGGGGDVQLGTIIFSPDRRAAAALVGGLLGPIFMRASGLG